MRIGVQTDGAPTPPFAFSQGVRRGAFVQVSGQGPFDPTHGTIVARGDVGAQTTQTLENVQAILEASGATFDDTVMLRVYLTSRDDLEAMNAAYETFVAEHLPSGVLPARTTLVVTLPIANMLVEIDGMAIIG